MMSEKSSRTVRSKIPIFQGPRKTSAAKTEFVDPKKDDFKQRGKKTKPGPVVNTSNADKHDRPSNDGDIPFEPDPQALDSILSNKGVNFGAIQASGMTPSFPVNRLSMWDSINEFKENLKQYKETFQQWNVNMNTEPKPQTPTDNFKKSAALTPRGGRTLAGSTEMSLLQSYEQHKENIKIFRETMRNIDNALLTPRAPGNGRYGEFTPGQRQRGLTNTVRATSSATPVNNHNRRAWTELKENRPPYERMKKPGALSTSKLNPSKLCAIDETRHGLSCASKVAEGCSARPVRRELLLSSDGNKETEQHASSTNCVQASKKYCNSVESNQPVAVSSSVRDDQMQHNTLYNNHGSESSLGLSTTSGIFLKSPDVIQVSRFMPVFLTPTSAALLGGYTECTWSCQQTLCTPRLKTSARVHEAAHNFHSIQNQQTIGKLTSDSYNLLSYNTQAVTSMGPTAGFSHTSRTSHDVKTALHLPLSSAGDLNDCFSKLLLNSNPTVCTASSSQSYPSVPKLWPESPPAVLRTPVSATPVRAFRGKTIMSATPSMSTNCLKLTVTPVSQVLRVSVRDQRSPGTPLYFSSQTARVNGAAASCLKKKEFIKLDNSDDPSLRPAVSSVKKIRWADYQGCVEQFEEILRLKSDLLSLHFPCA